MFQNCYSVEHPETTFYIFLIGLLCLNPFQANFSFLYPLKTSKSYVIERVAGNETRYLIRGAFLQLFHPQFTYGETVNSLMTEVPII